MEAFIQNYYVNRKNTNSIKWDRLKAIYGEEDLLPLWVADMDFRCPDAVGAALEERIRHGVYGYSYVGKDYYDAFFDWMSTRFGVNLLKEWIRFTPGVVKALYQFVNIYTEMNDSVLIMKPVYHPFSHAINDTGRRLVSVDLIEEEQYFRIDFQNLEQTIIDNQVKLFIFCSPHNPVGRVWTFEEINRILDICEKHQVLIISDEIHQDFVFQSHQQKAILSINHPYVYQGVIAVTSSSKTFNLAGMTHSVVMIPNEELRNQYDTYLKTVGGDPINLMATIATTAAYTSGEEWLKQVLGVINANYELITHSFANKAPEIVVYPLEGTYLAFINLNGILKGKDCKEFIQGTCKLAIDFGEWFGEGYEGYIRVNLATKPDNIQFMIDQIISNL